MNDDFEILDVPPMWEPYRDLESGVAWKKDKNYPGGYFYYDDCEENLIKVLADILDRPNPREPESYSLTGGQGEYFMSVKRDIIGIALLPKELLIENQITKDYTDPQSQTQIRVEGGHRLASGYSYHKNPPIVTRSPTASLFGIQSGHNRTEDFQNRFPNGLMLVIIVGDPKIHQNANCKLADVRSKLRANPQSRTRANKIEDRALAIKDSFDADPLIHDTDTGKPHNPDGKKLTDLDKDSDVWISCFEYICGDSIHPSTRTKIYNSVTGNKVTRRFVVGAKAVADDLHLYGWADGLIRKGGKILPDFKRVPWHQHVDANNGALIIAKEVAAGHFDTAIYGLITKYLNDTEWSNFLRQEGINKIFIHANLGAQIKSEDCLKNHQNKFLERCVEYNTIARTLGILEIKKVIFPKQQAGIEIQLIDIEKLEQEEN